MRDILKTNDAVLLSFARHVLTEAGIAHRVLDEHMSVLEGSVGAIPRRIAVGDGDYRLAKMALGNASITIPD